MLTAIESACFKYETAGSVRHIHVGMFDLWDVLAGVEIEAAPSGGTWRHLVTIPVNKLWVPEHDAQDQAFDFFRSIKKEERQFYQLVEVKHMNSCHTMKINWSFFHLLVNQHVDLYSPTRDGYIQ